MRWVPGRLGVLPPQVPHAAVTARPGGARDAPPRIPKRDRFGMVKKVCSVRFCFRVLLRVFGVCVFRVFGLCALCVFVCFFVSVCVVSRLVPAPRRRAACGGRGVGAGRSGVPRKRPGLQTPYWAAAPLRGLPPGPHGRSDRLCAIGADGASSSGPYRGRRVAAAARGWAHQAVRASTPVPRVGP